MSCAVENDVVLCAVLLLFLVSSSGCESPKKESSDQISTSNGTEFAAHLIVLPPLVLGYNDLYYDDQKPTEEPGSTTELSLRSFRSKSPRTVPSEPIKETTSVNHRMSGQVVKVNPENPNYNRVMALLNELMDLGVSVQWNKVHVENVVKEVNNVGVAVDVVKGVTPQPSASMDRTR